MIQNQMTTELHREVEDKDLRIYLRVSAYQKNIMQKAAQKKQQKLSAFVRDIAFREATEVLANEISFTLDPEQWDAFQQALDAPPRSLPKLKKLLSEPHTIHV